MPDVDRTSCEAMPETHVSPSVPWAIACMVLAIIGILSSEGVTIVFATCYETPFIKASGRELSMYLLVGIYISYVSVFIFVNKPTPGICGAMTILMGLSYSIVYASILTKINRISRIFNKAESTKKTKFVGPAAQITITSLLVLIEVIILVIWLALIPPDTTHVYPTRDDNILVCKGSEDASFLIPTAYPFLLMLGCIAYAYRTRKTPDGFNETRYIAFTTYTVFVLWVAMIPIYFSSDSPFLRTFVVCFSSLMNPTAVLAFIFSNKVCICLCEPEMNTKENVMNRRYGSGIFSVTNSSITGTLHTDK